MTVAAPPAGFRLTGWHVLAMIVAFFVIIIGLDTWFATLAYTTYSGDVASNPYEAGIAFNKTLAQRRREAALGWKVEADLSRPGVLALSFHDQANAPLDGLTITADLTRPATEVGKRVLAFKPMGDGRYVAPSGDMKGAWDLTATAHDTAGNSLEIADRFKAK